MNFETNPSKFKKVLSLAKTPSKQEFFEVAKISLGGIIAVGTLGYTVFWLMRFLPT